ARDSRVTVAMTGLGAINGAVTVFFDPSAIGGTSLYPSPSADASPIEVTIAAGDDYLRRSNLAHVDLLKIDVEGAEGDVLAGFEGALSARAIDVVQFEYGFADAGAHFTASDASTLFESHGYVVGRLFPHGVLFEPYHRELEDYRLALNRIAVRG